MVMALPPTVAIAVAGGLCGGGLGGGGWANTVAGALGRPGTGKKFFHHVVSPSGRARCLIGLANRTIVAPPGLLRELRMGNKVDGAVMMRRKALHAAERKSSIG